jgi:hypothetical protein
MGFGILRPAGNTSTPVHEVDRHENEDAKKTQR